MKNLLEILSPSELRLLESLLDIAIMRNKVFDPDLRSKDASKLIELVTLVGDTYSRRNSPVGHWS